MTNRAKMTELKTLKDLGDGLSCVFKEELKAEAVKDYKAVKNGDLVTDVCSYIKWKNNLTEEDLKHHQLKGGNRK